MGKYLDDMQETLERDMNSKLEEKVSALREKQDRPQSFAKIHSEKMDAEHKKLSDQHSKFLMEKADFEKKYAVFMKQEHEKPSPTVTKTHSLKQKQHREKSKERSKHGSESMKLKPSGGNYAKNQLY